ncbi:hypothetical protein EDB82DRAFT_462767 [Fusarium venenatum]|uniref:uncharacterized protein n=1 Tax=Fusarium venenatum TaxID=56646 RepID=UPI001D8BFE8C|nr:hypothetical protein EDB82DRAFT_462767 [Fusarium venenatum]
MFDSDFKEATLEKADGLYHWKFDAIFDPTAFEIVLKIIHGKNRDIPQAVDVQLLVGIPVVVDDLECHDVLWFFAKRWLAVLSQVNMLKTQKDVAQRILISFVFHDPVMFEASTKTAITGYWVFTQTPGLPIRPKILRLTKPDEIQKRTEKALAKLVDGLYDIERKLLNQKLGCNPGCRAMLLGTLIQIMDEYDLYSPRPTKPFYSLDLKTITQSIGKFQLPDYYSPLNESPIGDYSGVWSISSYPSRLSSQGRSSQPGWGFSNSETEAPQRLVQHHCSLRGFIDTLLQTAETEAKGLGLAEYSPCQFSSRDIH